jgi:hypothetical protein
MTMTMAAAQPWTLRHAALGLSLLVAALGATVLGGWVLDLGALRQIVPGAATMRVNTSVGLLCVGIALAALSRNKVPTASRVGACAVAAAVFIIGVLTLAQDIIGHDLGIDDGLLNGATTEPRHVEFRHGCRRRRRFVSCSPASRSPLSPRDPFGGCVRLSSRRWAPRCC